MQFKKTSKRAAQIGSDLGVSHLLAGSLRRTGSRIRIAVQLIDTESERQLWAEQYERDAADLLALQRDVAEAITRQISTSLGVARPTAYADARRHSTIAEAHEHYLRGRHHVWQRYTVEGFEKAREHFRKAIALDDSYARAYSGLSDTYTMLGSVGFMPMREAYPLARAAALKALALDGRLAEAHTSLAFILADFDWNWDTADRHFRTAVELNSNDNAAAAPMPPIWPGGGGTRRRSSSRAGHVTSTRCRRTRGRASAWSTTSVVVTTTRSHSFERRSISTRPSARLTSCWDEPMSPRVYLIEPSRSSSAPKRSWGPAPTSLPPWPTSLRRLDTSERH